MTELSPQERRQQRTREAILTAARDLIAEKGADKLSLRAIARRIDYSPAGLYEYFDGKDAIIGALCERGSQQLTRYVQRVPTDLPIAERLAAMMRAYVDFARENPEFFQLLFTTMQIGVGGFEDIESNREEYPEDAFYILYDTIQAAIAAGDLRPREGYGAFELAYSLWTMAHGMAVLQTGYLRDFDFDFISADTHTVHTFLTGLQHPD